MKNHKQILEEIALKIQNGDKSIPQYVTLENDRIVIKEVNKDYKESEKDKSVIDSNVPDKYVMVHTTSFFPLNHQILTGHDGNNDTEYSVQVDNLNYNVSIKNHRLTTHHTINARVKDNDGGSWKEKKYMVIEPLEPHLSQIININPNDSYTYGSLKLTDQAIILGTKEALDEIPDEEKKSYLLIQINEESQEKGVNAVLELLGYEIHQINAQDASHHNSFENNFEKYYSERDALVNIIINNWDNTERNIELSEKNIGYLYELSKKQSIINYNIGQISQEEFNELSDKLNIPSDFIKLMTNMRYYYK